MADQRKTHFKNGFLAYEGQHSIKFKPNSSVQSAAAKDPDAQSQTLQELAKFKRVNPFAHKNN